MQGTMANAICGRGWRLHGKSGHDGSISRLAGLAVATGHELERPAGCVVPSRLVASGIARKAGVGAGGCGCDTTTAARLRKAWADANGPHAGHSILPAADGKAMAVVSDHTPPRNRRRRRLPRAPGTVQCARRCSAPKPRRHQAPHVYAIAEEACRKAWRDGGHQSLIISGESGAGKTEANRQLMNYLVWRGSTKGAANTLTQKILDANPILESFGNAKTTRNNSSSRCGRYVLVRFSDTCTVVGAQVRTFLLERSRVVAPSSNERSFHVMYELCRGGGDVLTSECRLPAPSPWPTPRPPS